MDQRQLPFVVADQLVQVGFVAHQMQGIVGGYPAAAHICRGAESVAVFVDGNVVLVIDQTVHKLLLIPTFFLPPSLREVARRSRDGGDVRKYTPPVSCADSPLKEGAGVYSVMGWASMYSSRIRAAVITIREQGRLA